MEKQNYTSQQYMKFIIPSLFGAVCFLLPIPTADGTLTTILGMLVDATRAALKPSLPYIALVITVASGVMTAIAVFQKPKWIMDNELLKRTFFVGPLWWVSRIAGSVIMIMVVFKLGPEFIWSMDTGGTCGIVLLPILTPLFVYACFLIAPLTDFGFMEWAGTMARPFMRPLFTLPGRASIDCLASWLGSPSVGVIITRKQFEEGYYSGREAAVISTTFSIVGIAYIYVMVEFVGLPHMYFQMLISTYVVSLVLAFIMPRIWPLGRVKDTYYYKETDEFRPEGRIREDDIDPKYTLSQWALKTAVERAEKSTFDSFLKEGLRSLLGIYSSIFPLVMSWGTLALVIATYTPVFEWLSYPFYFLLNLVNCPEPAQVGIAFVLSYADQFLAGVIGASVASEVAKFMCAGISITGLIYLTEVGVLVLDSKIPLNFIDLTVIYIERAIVTIFLLMPFALFFCS